MSLLWSIHFPRRSKALLRDKRGAVGATTALTIAALCGLIGLGADTAVWYANAHRVQTMAETAALSAGRLLTSSSQTSSTITAVAENDMTLNGYSSASDTVSVAFGPSGKTPPNATTVTVTVKRKLPLLFSGVFLHSKPVVSASATAASKQHWVLGLHLCARAVDVPVASGQQQLHSQRAQLRNRRGFDRFARRDFRFRRRRSASRKHASPAPTSQIMAGRSAA